MGAGVGVIKVFTKLLYVPLFFWLFDHRIFESLGPGNLETFFSWEWHQNHWWAWIILFFLDDFIFYWFHRSAHEVRLLWAGHVNHHSSQDYNFATAIRQGWWEDVYKYLFWLILPLLGFHPFMVFIMLELNLIYQFFMHTETVGRLGFLEYFMNTPSHHRVHHGSDIIYLDRNYAGVLIIWDRLFGSFQEELAKPNYGLTTNINTHNPLKIASHELIDLGKDVAKAPTVSDKFKYLLLGPGWSHDGEDQRAKVLQKKE